MTPSELFAIFWSEYPRHVARAHAFKMFMRLTSEEMELAVAAIPIHAKMWKLEQRPLHRIPHAGSWLNPVDGRRWEDEIELEEFREQRSESPAQARQRRQDESEQRVMRMLAKSGGGIPG